MTSTTVRSPASQRANHELELPARYPSASVTAALLPVHARDARTVLAGVGLSPVRLPGSRALLMVAWFRYADSSIGPYEEMSVSLLASLRELPASRAIARWLAGDPSVAGYVLHLPVTSERACAGGQAVFGYPKFVAEIAYQRAAQHVEAALAVAGNAVLSMTLPLRRGLPLRMRTMPTFSVLDGELLATRVAADGPARLCPGAGVQIRAHDPMHPVNRTLRALGAGPAWAVLDAPRFHATLPAPLRLSRT